ncbi:hypothetical protein E6C60_4023 [Paenibacillus algicola]|uniref:Uncharacterized protein n=1 Tax=Paenibacillus algicola TaxID=2565926 RepID=A0A4P8XPY3_9BACL|nr:hypothetical protein E6C60_4023 [Paenibacillus algicola]
MKGKSILQTSLSKRAGGWCKVRHNAADEWVPSLQTERLHDFMRASRL